MSIIPILHSLGQSTTAGMVPYARRSFPFSATWELQMHNHLDQDDGRPPSYHDFASLVHSPWRNIHFSRISQRTLSVLLIWDIQSNLEFDSS
jgi:hypothetical protein